MFLLELCNGHLLCFICSKILAIRISSFRFTKEKYQIRHLRHLHHFAIARYSNNLAIYSIVSNEHNIIQPFSNLALNSKFLSNTIILAKPINS